MPTDICLPTLKYSHATGHRSDNTVPWTHLVAPDIFVIIKGVDTHVTDGKLNMKVVHGNIVLESIDVGAYIEASLDARRRAESAGISPTVDQMLIFGITKEASLALRYRQDGSQVHRLQLRLQNSAECRQLVETLLRRGMEFQEQRLATTQYQKSRPNTAADQERLLTADSTSRGLGSETNVTTARPNPFKPQVLETGSLSEQRSINSQRPQPGYESATHQMAPPRLSTRNGGDTFLVPSHPSTTQMYSSYTTPSQPFQSSSLSDIERQPTSVHQDRPTSSSHVHTLQVIRDGAERLQSPPESRFEIPPPSLRVPTSYEHRTSNSAQCSTPILLSSDPLGPLSDTARPSSSSSVTWPREKAPVKRPESHHSASDRSGSRPGSSSLSMPPLPKPKLLKETSTPAFHPNPAPHTKQSAPSRPATASPLKRSLAVADAEPVRAQTAVSSTNDSHTSGRQDGPRDEMRLATHALAPPEPAIRRITPMNELLYGKKPLAERSTNSKVLRMSSLADAPHEEISPPPSRSEETTIPQDADISMTLHYQGNTSLEEYAGQSQADRQAALDDFMVAHLENPAFATLCQDVENSWRRIALGL